MSDPWLRALLGSLLLLALAWIARALLLRYLAPVLARGLARITPHWAETRTGAQVPARLIALVPVLIIHHGALAIPSLTPALVTFVERLTLAVLAILAARAVGAGLEIAHSLYAHHPASGGRPVKGYVQVTRLILYIVAAIAAVAVLADQSPWYFVSGLGAMTAVIMLIFRDTLLSLVAGVQLVNYDLVRVGDWIEMPELNADGYVIDMSLNVVRVQNWDRTITAIPAHRFLEDSFRNWRGMFDSGGRRISRTLHIDMASIRFLTPEEIDHFRRFRLLTDYINRKEEELAEWNARHASSDSGDIKANVRMLTNIGTLRAYVQEYVARHPHIHHDQLILIRQMEPGPHGVGIQIYAFTNDTRWVAYEGIQGDIFDHVMAMVPEFGLRIYQAPSGHDIKALGDPLLGPGRSSSPARS